MSVLVSAVVVSYGAPAMLERCLDSLAIALTEVPGETEMVVVDNGARDGRADRVRELHPSATVVEIEVNEGFAGGVEPGIEAAAGRWIVLLNDDALLEPPALRRMVEAGERYPDVGAIAAQMRFAGRPGLINSAGIEVDRLGVAFDRGLGRPADPEDSPPVEVFGASGGAAAYRKEMLDEIGGFDASFFAYLEDVDLAWRAREAGWRALYVPGAIAYHWHSATTRHRSPSKYRLVGRNRVRVLAKNADRGMLLRWGWAMIAYDLGYVLYVLATERKLAPLQGRIEGLREWRRYRQAGSEWRCAVRLARVRGTRAALNRHAAWATGGSTPDLP